MNTSAICARMALHNMITKHYKVAEHISWFQRYRKNHARPIVVTECRRDEVGQRRLSRGERRNGLWLALEPPNAVLQKCQLPHRRHCKA